MVPRSIPEARVVIVDNNADEQARRGPCSPHPSARRPPVSHRAMSSRQVVPGESFQLEEEPA
jgi:hypothetical protein